MPKFGSKSEEDEGKLLVLALKKKRTHQRRLCQRNDRTLWKKMVGVGSEFAKQWARDSVALSMYDA